MLSEFWVKIQAKPGYSKGTWQPGSVGVTKAKPGTAKNEVAVKVSVDIPDAYFNTPELSVNIIVPKEAVNRPIITPDVEDNLAASISEQLGFRVHVTATPKED